MSTSPPPNNLQTANPRSAIRPVAKLVKPSYEDRLLAIYSTIYSPKAILSVVGLASICGWRKCYCRLWTTCIHQHHTLLVTTRRVSSYPFVQISKCASCLHEKDQRTLQVMTSEGASGVIALAGATAIWWWCVTQELKETHLAF